MSTYRISEAASRTGLPVSTLRYYERIGLLPEPQRTASGYRAYEEQALDRLAFIARARELGLQLDDIGGLADLWNAERCGPVQARLRELISAKIVETEEQVAALSALSADLASFITGLTTPAPDAPCGDGCGCDRPPASPGAPEQTLTILPSLGPGLACSLDSEDVAGRLAEWRAVATQATDRVVIEGGIRLALLNPDLPALADLVAREQACCSFLTFAVRFTPTGTTLDITGPTAARPLIEALA